MRYIVRSAPWRETDKQHTNHRRVAVRPPTSPWGHTAPLRGTVRFMSAQDTWGPSGPSKVGSSAKCKVQSGQQCFLSQNYNNRYIYILNDFLVPCSFVTWNTVESLKNHCYNTSPSASPGGESTSWNKKLPNRNHPNSPKLGSSQVGHSNPR